jgi:hypothetical protein
VPKLGRQQISDLRNESIFTQYRFLKKLNKSSVRQGQALPLQYCQGLPKKKFKGAVAST